MLDFVISEWIVNEYSTGEAPIPGESFKTYRQNEFAPEELKELQTKVQTAYWDKDSRD